MYIYTHTPYGNLTCLSPLSTAQKTPCRPNHLYAGAPGVLSQHTHQGQQVGVGEDGEQRNIEDNTERVLYTITIQ